MILHFQGKIIRKCDDRKNRFRYICADRRHILAGEISFREKGDREFMKKDRSDFWIGYRGDFRQR